MSSCATWAWWTLHMESTLHNGQCLGKPIHQTTGSPWTRQTWDSEGTSQKALGVRPFWQRLWHHQCYIPNPCYHRVHGRQDKGCHLLLLLFFFFFTIVWGPLENYYPLHPLESPQLVLFWSPVQRQNLSFQESSHFFLSLQGRQLRQW